MRPITGNEKLLDSKLWEVNFPKTRAATKFALDELEKEVETKVLEGYTIVLRTSIHPDAMLRAGVVPLRWGSPRIIIADAGWVGYNFKQAILKGEEPCRPWKLWRYRWDDTTDLLCLPALKVRRLA
jgi:hypothetical protein